MNNQWIRIFSSTNFPQASIIKGMLEENHVPVTLINKQDSSYVNFGEIELYVPRQYKEVAKGLIGEE